MSITQILLKKGLLTPEQLDEATALHKAEDLRLDRAIVQLGFLTERQLLEVMSEQLHLPLVSLADVTIDTQTLRALPPKLVYRKRLVPISQTNGSGQEEPGGLGTPGKQAERRVPRFPHRPESVFTRA